MSVIRDPKNFCFNFYFPKHVDKNLMREIEFIIKSNKIFSSDYNKKQY